MYYFGDLDEQNRLLHGHGVAVARVNAVREVMTPPQPPILFDLNRALFLLRKRVHEFYGGTSRYAPHQGKREMARRAA